jgi:hypothetical protein
MSYPVGLFPAGFLCVSLYDQLLPTTQHVSCWHNKEYHHKYRFASRLLKLCPIQFFIRYITTRGRFLSAKDRTEVYKDYAVRTMNSSHCCCYLNHLCCNGVFCLTINESAESPEMYTREIHPACGTHFASACRISSLPDIKQAAVQTSALPVILSNRINKY